MYYAALTLVVLLLSFAVTMLTIWMVELKRRVTMLEEWIAQPPISSKRRDEGTMFDDDEEDLE